MARTLAEIADWVGGTVHGDGQTLVSGAAPQGLARPGQITLIDSAERAEKHGTGQAVAAIVPLDVELTGIPTIQVEDVHAAFSEIVIHFQPPRVVARCGISPQAVVSPTARLAADVDVHAGAVIGDDVEIASGTTIHSGTVIMAGCRIGPDTTLFPRVTLYENTVIGARVIVHAGAVLGAYGYGYKYVDGQHRRCAQLGNVEIADDVEIGANTTIDRGAYGPTTVGEGTKIDNLVMIAHNCQIGRNNLICSQVGIAGSSSTGDHVIMAGQVGVRDHVHIGSHAVAGAKAGIRGDVEAGTSIVGIPAIRDRDFWVQQALLGKLPDMRRQIRQLETTLAELKAQQQATQPSDVRKDAAA